MVCQQWAYVDEAHICIAESGCRLLAGHMSWEVFHKLSLHHVLTLLIACHGQEAVQQTSPPLFWETIHMDSHKRHPSFI